MTQELHLPLVLLAAFVSSAAPGPATLAIAGASMAHGRRRGLALAAGVTTGSWVWSCAAALGLGAVMRTHVWLFESVRVAGAAYLLYLAWRSARSALSTRPASVPARATGGAARAYATGVALHLTNPKAVLFFGALFSIGLPPGTSTTGLATVVLAVGLQSALVFHGYALLFSDARAAGWYARSRRPFEGAFAVAFAAAGARVLVSDGR